MNFTTMGKSSPLYRASRTIGTRYRKMMMKRRARTNRPMQIGMMAVVIAAALGAGFVLFGRMLASTRPTPLTVETVPPWDSVAPETT